MGYYSDFTITLSDPVDDIIEQLDAITGYHFYLYDAHEVSSGDSIKWYGSHGDMILLSKDNPDIEFDLEQIGEDGDGSRAVYKAGSVIKEYRRSWEEVDR